MWTYSHGFKVPVEPLGDLVHKLAASYRDTLLRPSQGGDPHPRLAGDSTNGPVVIDHHLTRAVQWVPRELESISALIRGRNYENNHTRNLQEMALTALPNIGSSRPSRPVNFLRSASPIFMPGTPFTVKAIGSDRSKSHRLLPCGTLTSRPKSARRAWPAPSIRILALTISVKVGERVLPLENVPP